MLAAGALVLGVCSILLGGPEVRTAVLVPLVPAAAVTPWLVRGRQKSLLAEILIVVATGVWFVSFGLATVAVHGLKLSHKGRPGARRLRLGVLLLGGGVWVLGFVAAAEGHVPLLVPASVVPPVAVACVVSVVAVHPRRLKTVGWSLVSANAITLICLLLL
jgi:peptidoglycan/LPS O-acetylase OafA/YrhL